MFMSMEEAKVRYGERWHLYYFKRHRDYFRWQRGEDGLNRVEWVAAGVSALVLALAALVGLGVI